MTQAERDQELALAHAEGVEAGIGGGDPETDCPYPSDRPSFRQYWLNGYAIGMLQRGA